MINDKIEIVKSLDWLTCSLPVEYNELQKTSQYEWTLPYGGGFDHKGVGKAMRYYKKAIELTCGGTLQFSENTESVKPHALLNLTGENLNWLHQRSPVTDEKLISWVHINAKNVTRIDFAIDIFGGGNVPQFLYGLQSGIVKTRGKVENYEAITGQRGHTVYVGSKDSDLRMRVYDKGAEMEKFTEIWTRIELQARGDYAKALSVDMNNKGVAIGGTDRVNKFVDGSNLDWWRLAVDSEGKPSSGYDQNEGGWRRWVMDTVLPSLLSHAETDEDVLAMVAYALHEKLLNKS